MYTEDDFMTRRDRVNENLLRQLLGENDNNCTRNKTLNDNQRNASNAEREVRLESTHNTWGLNDHPLAMVYSPLQKWRNIYDNETALMNGTIFEELYLPFMGSWNNGSGGCSENDGCNSNGGCGCGGGRNG